MKLLFIYINPTGRSAMPPNITMLLGYLKRKSNHTVEVFDTTYYRFDLGQPVVESSWTPGYFLPTDKKIAFPVRETDLDSDLAIKIRDTSPDLIAVSCYSNQYQIASGILKSVKEKFPQIPTLVGGCHASFSPEKVIADPNIDMICVGEGEVALLELCNRIDRKEDVRYINNLWVKDNGNIIRNSVGAPISLDEIGEPDWDAFDSLHIYQPFHGSYFKVGMVEFGRGCPFECTYCANKSYIKLYKDFKKEYFRHRDPKEFIKILKKKKDTYALELIYFQDGTFLTMPDEVLKELAELYEREINLPCIILTTVTTINEWRLSCLNRMNCIYINLGIEAGNPEFRKNILKRNMSDDQIINAFKMIREHKIYTAAYTVIGFPYETRENIFQTIELTRKCRPDSIYTQVFYPIHGCDLTNICLEQGYFDSANESLYSQIKDMGNVSVLEHLSLAREEIHGLLRTFYLYAKMPAELFGTIQTLEEDTPLSRKIISGLTDYYKKQEPYFGSANDINFKKPSGRCCETQI